MRFFYEYARESKKITRLVDIYREFHPYISSITRNPLSFDSEKFEKQSVKEQERIKMLTGNFSRNAMLYLIDWLSFISKFPLSPYLSLKENEIKNGREMPKNIRGVEDIVFYFPDGAAICLPAFFGGKSFTEIFENTIPNYQSAHVMLIDWRKTNVELVDDFRDWIEMSRNFTKTQPIREASRGIFNEELDLPKECKKVDTALFHLGKLRCNKSCASMDEYMKIYHPSNIDRRSIQKDISAARAVLSWLESKV